MSQKASCVIFPGTAAFGQLVSSIQRQFPGTILLLTEILVVCCSTRTHGALFYAIREIIPQSFQKYFNIVLKEFCSEEQTSSDVSCEEQIQLHYLPVCHLLFSPNTFMIQILPAGCFPPFKWLLARPNLAVPFYFLHLNETVNRESAFGARKIQL